MDCPVCKNTQLVMSDRQGIEIDYCPNCRGVWLDRGELDKIIDRSAGASAPPQGYPAAQPPHPGHQHPAGYGYPQYMADMTALIAKLGVASVDWVGTSRGGIIGMMLAAQPNSPIRRLVLNDVGPFIPKAALERIAGYVGLDPTFDSVGDLEAYLRKVHETFGPLSDSDWRHLALQGYRRLDDGRFGLAYDPGIAQAFRTKIEDVEFWPVWDAIACPVLILRGARSDLLPARTAAEMTRRGPKGMLVEIAEAGHAPALMTPEQIGIVRDWLGAE